MGCAVEGDYVPHSAAMLHSVLAQSGGYEVHVHYLHPPGLPAEARQGLDAMIARAGAEVTFVEVPDEVVAELPTEGFTGKATWYRALLPQLLPENLDRILFLDADLLALDALAPLWETDLSGHYLAAVTNVFQADHLFRAAQLGFDRPQSYFNAGVMLLDLKLMRRDGCAEAMRRYGVAHAGDLMFRDQDALNVVLAGRRLPLHPRWNSMNSFQVFPWSAYVFGSQAVDEAGREPGIRHFEGPGANKPWHRGCRFAHREAYFEHRHHTPWSAVEMVGRAPGRLSRARRLAGRLRRRLSA